MPQRAVLDPADVVLKPKPIFAGVFRIMLRLGLKAAIETLRAILQGVKQFLLLKLKELEIRYQLSELQLSIQKVISSIQQIQQTLTNVNSLLNQVSNLPLEVIEKEFPELAQVIRRIVRDAIAVVGKTQTATARIQTIVDLKNALFASQLFVEDLIRQIDEILVSIDQALGET